MTAAHDALRRDLDQLLHGTAGTTVLWALTGAGPGVREQVVSQLPTPARLLYRTVWLPRYARTTPPP
jgi:hypothetical protein